MIKKRSDVQKRSGIKKGNDGIWSRINKFINLNFKLSLQYLSEIRNYILSALLLFIVMGNIGFEFPIFFRKEIIAIIVDLIKRTEGLGFLGLTRFIMVNNIQSAFFGVVFGIFLGIFPLIITVVNGYVLGFVANETVAVNGTLILWRLLPHGIFEIPAIMIAVGAGVAFGFRFLHKIYKNYFEDSIPFPLFIFFGFLILPLTLMIVVFSFLFSLYYYYIKYYLDKKKNLFLILSLIIFPIMIFNIIFNRKLKTFWNEDYSDSLRVFVLVVIPLLVLAAIIEGALIIFLG